MKTNKTYTLLSILIAATVLGVLVFSTSASERPEEEQTAVNSCRFHEPWLNTLTEEQRETLNLIIEENQEEIQNQLEAWGVEISELNEEQRETLKQMMKANRAEIEAQLEEWGIEYPVVLGQKSLLDNLTDEQKEELQTMKQDYQDAVKAKLEEWGIEVPEFTVPPQGFGMRFHGRGASGFDLFKP